MRSGYMNLAKMVAMHFIIMFALTYSMVNSVDNIHLNINRMYMAAMMVSPMVVLMLILMPSMFPNQKLNYLLMAIFTAALVIFFLFVRTQAFVQDRQFLRSMIPHHSSAILMCEKASITDQEIQSLCGEIVESQKREIAQMERILKRMN